MPIVRIDIATGYDSAYHRALLDGVHEALVHAFQIPESDRNQILREHADTHFERSGGKTRQCTFVEISAFAGRTRDAKRRLYARIVENLARSPGIAATDVLIVLQESPLENWGVSGGQMADEVNLGFRVDV